MMHVCDCSGVMNTIIGSVLRPLLYDNRLGQNVETRLQVVNERLRAFYAARPGIGRLPELRPQNLSNDQGWAFLCGVVVKAARTRALAPWMVEISNEFYGADDEYSRLVRRACKYMDHFYNILYGASVILTPEESLDLRRTTVRFGICMQQLRELSRVKNQLCWGILPKAHYMQHLCDLPVNARWVQNYAEESHVGTLAKIWSRSAHGRYRRTAQKVILLKRLVAMYIRIEGF